MASQIHGIVQDPNDIDDARLRYSVDQNVSAPSPPARDVHRPQPEPNVVAAHTPVYVGAFPDQLGNRGQENLFVSSRLSSAECTRGPSEHCPEIFFGRIAEMDLPIVGVQSGLVVASDRLFTHFAKITDEIVAIGKFLEGSALEGRCPHIYRISQRSQSRSVLYLAPLN